MLAGFGRRLADQAVEAVGGQEVLLRQRIRACGSSGPASAAASGGHGAAASSRPTGACQFGSTGDFALGEQGVGRQPRDRLQAVDARA